MWAHRIGTNENPILPRRQPAKNARLHCFRRGPTEVGFQARQGVRRQCGAAFNRLANLIGPIQLVGGKGYQAEFQSLPSVQRLANTRVQSAYVGWVSLKTRRQTRDAIDCRQRPEVHLRQNEYWRG